MLLAIFSKLKDAQNCLNDKLFFNLQVDIFYLRRDPFLPFQLKLLHRRVDKAITLLEEAIAYMQNIKERVETKEIQQKGSPYRRVVGSERDRLLLELVKKESKSIRAVLFGLKNWFKELGYLLYQRERRGGRRGRRGRTEMEGALKPVLDRDTVKSIYALETEIKGDIALIQKAIKDILNFLASESLQNKPDLN